MNSEFWGTQLVLTITFVTWNHTCLWVQMLKIHVLQPYIDSDFIYCQKKRAQPILHHLRFILFCIEMFIQFQIKIENKCKYANTNANILSFAKLCIVC